MVNQLCFYVFCQHGIEIFIALCANNGDQIFYKIDVLIQHMTEKEEDGVKGLILGRFGDFLSTA